MISVLVVTVFFVVARSMSKSRFGNCVLLILFLFIGSGFIWNARANKYVLSNGQRTTASVVYSTASDDGAGRIINYRYPGAGRRNPLHLFNVFFVVESQSENIGTAFQAGDFGATWGRAPKTVTIAYLPNNPRAHVVLEDCSTEVFYGASLLCLSAAVWVVLNLICLRRDQSSGTAAAPDNLLTNPPSGSAMPATTPTTTLARTVY